MDFIYLLKIIVLAIVEGLTEFLPVSSTGHLIIVSSLLNIPENNFIKLLMIVIQLAAILAVVVLFFKKLWRLFIDLINLKKPALHFWAKWILASVPFVVLAVPLHKYIEQYLYNTLTVAIALILGGLLLYFGENYQVENPRCTKLANLSYKQALIIGTWQCLALFPGFSRSASTIIGGWLAGLKTKLAAEFSFFLAIPLMFGATIFSVYKFLKLKSSLANLGETLLAEQAVNLPFLQAEKQHYLASNSELMQYIYLGIACLVSFLVALIVVKAFMQYLSKHSLKEMAIYRIVVGVVLCLLWLANLR